jgi:hypothetical protein
VRLFDHLVSPHQESGWEREIECVGGLHVHDQLHFCNLLHREIGWFLFLKNAGDVSTS